MIRDIIQKRFEEIRRHHAEGATGEQVIAAMTDLTDEVIERVYTETLHSVPAGERWKFEDGLAIVALGGYGRGERSPYSDIDIMFLHRPALRRATEGIPGRMLQVLWDIGFQVGHSTRTVRDCIEIGRADLTVRTALMEARFLTGSRALFDQFRSRYRRKVTLRRPGHFARAKILSREAEVDQYGTTVHLLEPHIKKSRGGLRDIHLLRWLSQIRYQTPSLDSLKQQGLLSKQDHRALTEAQEFLWRNRNELHFAAGRCQDTLTFDDQIRLAERWGYHDGNNLLAVEQFMQRYYDHTRAIAEITGRSIEAMASTGLWRRFRNRLSRRRVGEFFILSGNVLSIPPDQRSNVLSRGERILEMFRRCQAFGARLSVETQGALRDRMGRWSADLFSSPESHSAFLSILSDVRGLSRTLRDLHRYRILEQILPAFRRVRGLMQFNLYHKFTVDEHCIRAVEEAERLSEQMGIAPKALKEIGRREILVLALLLHDLGKGLGGNHSEEGASMASEAAKRLGLDSAASESLVFLVRHHLRMTHVAFRRDLADDRVLTQFAKSVGTPDVLKMLFILTICDVSAVGPGTLTAWKKDLLTELYGKTLGLLTGETPMIAEEEKAQGIRDEVEALLGETHPAGWLKAQLAAMTNRYLVSIPTDRIVLDLERVSQLSPGSVSVHAQNDPERNLTEYSVYTFDDITPGIFYKITSVLAAKGLQILSAAITTWSNGVVVDSFWVGDPDYAGPPVGNRLRDVRETIARVLRGHLAVEGLFSEGERISLGAVRFPLSAPVQVELDNSISERYSIVEVFAQDRPGLLAVMARVLFAEGLSIQTAKVATHLDQVVDIFHVTDRSGQKITDPDRIRHLKQTLQSQIEHHLEVSRVP